MKDSPECPLCVHMCALPRACIPPPPPTHTHYNSVTAACARVLSLAAAFLFAGVASAAHEFPFFAYRSFLPEHDAMRRFAEQADVNVVTLFPANTYNMLGTPYCAYPANWTWWGTIDEKAIDRQFDEVIAVNPRVKFICLVDLNTPYWMYRRLGPQGYDSFCGLSNALCSGKWRAETERYLRLFLAHVESRYAGRVLGYVLACGKTTEWMDVSDWWAAPDKTAKWDAWRKAKGLAPAPVPTPDRMRQASFDNFIRDPSRERDELDYAAFSNEIVAEAIVRFAAVAREVIPAERKLGVFFGYILQLWSGALTSYGHLGYEKVFASPDLDFFISPGSYFDRPMGAGTGFMGVHGTCRRYGKTWVHEIDHWMTGSKSPHASITPGASQMWKTEEEILAGLKRETGFAIVMGESLWCFDMWGGFFSTAAQMKTLARAKAIWSAEARRRTFVPDTALIVDPQSLLQINDLHRFTPRLYQRLRSELSRTGAAFEAYSFDDIGETDLSAVRLFIFPAAFLLTPERRARLEREVFKPGKTALFVYAPGISDGRTLDVARVRELTGAAFGAKGLGWSERNGCRIAYVAAYADVDMPLLRQVQTRAGVHFYADAGLPVATDGRLLSVHAAIGGRRTIRLPFRASRVTELWSDRIVAEDAAAFDFTFGSPDTAMFRVERAQSVPQERKDTDD